MSDAFLPGDPESPIKTEPVEDWTFVGAGGVSTTFRVHLDRGEKAGILRNAIDNSPIMVMLLLKDGTEKNETAMDGGFVIANLVSYFREPKHVPIYPKGEAPEEKELARVAELRAKRAEAFERRQAAMEADFEREMSEKG